MVSKRYTERKARMDADPAYAGHVLQMQQDSRRRRRDKAHAALEHPCQHRYPAGRRCWKTYPHTHRAWRFAWAEGEVTLRVPEQH